MRLQILHQGYRPIQKLIMSFMFGKRVPGPVAVMSYRRAMFGKYMGTYFQEAMRKTKHWQIGEVELFAAHVSSLQKCRF
ncbi:MAG: hypothetical protein KJ063_12950 [Anaerolineae bacterium]|nr:hypothetical protein [Anaerolineae bacterium]